MTVYHCISEGDESLKLLNGTCEWTDTVDTLVHCKNLSVLLIKV